MNLLKETKNILKMNGKKGADIIWCGSLELCFSWNKFKEMADFEYNDGYGGQEIAEDLLIVGNNWWLERHEYDGSEWWEYKELPKLPKKTKRVTILLKGNGGWNKLKEINN